MSRSTQAEKDFLMEHIIFSPPVWKGNMKFIFDKPPALSLGALQPLKSCIFLVESSDVMFDEAIRDDLGLPVIIRMAIFVVHLLKAEFQISNLLERKVVDEETSMDTLLYSLAILREVISDGLMIPGQSILFSASGNSDHQEIIQELLHELDNFFDEALSKLHDLVPIFNAVIAKPENAISNMLWALFKTTEDNSTCLTYYSGRALASQLRLVKQSYTAEELSKWIDRMSMRKSESTLHQNTDGPNNYRLPLKFVLTLWLK